MVNNETRYNLTPSDGSTYQRIVSLLAENYAVDAATNPNARPLVLDLACGNGPLAELVNEDLGLTYVGIDIDADRLRKLSERGYETHSLNLNQSCEIILAKLRDIIGDRNVAAFTMLDGIEHLSSPGFVLDALAKLAQENNALVGISVPNVAHRDVGIKLAMGSWDYTESGLLDTTHVRFYTEQSLEALLFQHGLRVIARSDLELETSDQHFPQTHPALTARTSLAQLLRYVREKSDDNGSINQFVWLALPGPARSSANSAQTQVPGPNPFLSVVLRTQGTRTNELREVLLCLIAQTNQDFEVHLIGHNLTKDAQLEIADLLRRLPAGFRERAQLHLCDGGTRSRPLNVGLRAARGEYVAYLDDDDFVLGHWVETFHLLQQQARGTVLRARCAKQSSERCTVLGRSATTNTSSISLPYEEDFSLVSHLIANQTPFMSVAFPRALYADFNEEFDELLSTTEDWDYLLRSAALVGVTDSPEITAIYRQWRGLTTSQVAHRQEEWESNQVIIERKMNARPIILQAGEVVKLRALNHLNSHESFDSEAAEEMRMRWERRARMQSEAFLLITARRWRYSAPLRWVSGIFGRPRGVSTQNILEASDEELEAAIRGIRQSTSWNLFPHRNKKSRSDGQLSSRTQDV